MSAAERKRLERRMKRAGKVHIRFWTDEANLAATLEATGNIDPLRADYPAALSDGTRRFVESVQIAVARDTTR